MKRSEFKRKTPIKSGGQLKRSAMAVKKRSKPMSHGLIAPNAAERLWLARVADLGCIVCLLFHDSKTPCAVHHIVEGGRRLGHMWTIGLCDPGHHQNSPDKKAKISRHPTRARFVEAYGTEYGLLEKTKELLGEHLK